MENEIWKDINGYEGLYQISSLGRVKSFAKVKTGKRPSRGYYCGREIYMSICDNGRGYMFVSIRCGSKKKNKYIHRLLAQHFIPNPQNKPQVNHINGIKSDNRIENLEWVTERENAIHAFKNGYLHQLPKMQKLASEATRGEQNTRSILKDIDIPIIFKMNKAGHIQSSIAKHFGVCRATIGYVLNRKTWNHVSC